VKPQFGAVKVIDGGVKVTCGAVKVNICVVKVNSGAMKTGFRVMKVLFSAFFCFDTSIFQSPLLNSSNTLCYILISR
jgi:hypothetical protein